MEQKQILWSSVYDGLPPLCSKYPWLVAHNLKDDTEDQIFFTVHDPMPHFRCRIPELIGKRIRGCFHGWVILSQKALWSLWNPVTSKTICLPHLILKDGHIEYIQQCCLSSPPNNSSSVLMLTRTKKPTIVFCRLDCQRKRLRWMEMTFAKQIRSIIGDYGFLHSLTCCGGKVYAFNSGHHCDRFVIQVDILFKDGEFVISLSPIVKLPFASFNGCSSMMPFLKGYNKELFYVKVGFDDEANKTLGAVYLFKLDMANMIWQNMEDLKDAIFFVDFAHDYSIFYRPTIASELGGYIHILGKQGKVLCSYDVKDKTISLSYMPCLVPASHVSLWECSLEAKYGEIKCRANFKPEKDNEDEIVVRPLRDDQVCINSTRNEVPAEKIKSHILNAPFDVLEMIMKFCVGVEYLNFRATCTHCRLAAPMISWSNETKLRRLQLQTYSLVSPWLMVFDKHQGIITFTDPMFGENYFIKTPQELLCDLQIYCSRYGWLLMFKLRGSLLFYNPFTSDIRELPRVPRFESFCFSAPPTSPNCMVVGFSKTLVWNVCIHFVGREPSWRMFGLDFGGVDPYSFRFPTFHGPDLYALFNNGGLDVFTNIGEEYYSWGQVLAEAPTGCCRFSAQYFLVKCDQHFLLVIVDEFGESVEIFKLNHSTKKWDKIDTLGRNVIYICGTLCLCIEAKTPEMENKIYFPRLHSEDGKIVFYSLDTCMYHTFNHRNIKKGFEDFFGTKSYFYPHAWIEPSWS